jgi:hypothetical protein
MVQNQFRCCSPTDGPRGCYRKGNGCLYLSNETVPGAFPLHDLVQVGMREICLQVKIRNHKVPVKNGNNQLIA